MVAGRRARTISLPREVADSFDRWLIVRSGLKTKALISPTNRHGNIYAERMCGASIFDRVQEWSERAGLGRLSCEDLRAPLKNA